MSLSTKFDCPLLKESWFFFQEAARLLEANGEFQISLLWCHKVFFFFLRISLLTHEAFGPSDQGVGAQMLSTSPFQVVLKRPRRELRFGILSKWFFFQEFLRNCVLHFPTSRLFSSKKVCCLVSHILSSRMCFFSRFKLYFTKVSITFVLLRE